MTSVRSARISRLKRHRERLAAGIDEDDAVVQGLLDEISRENIRMRHFVMRLADTSFCSGRVSTRCGMSGMRCADYQLVGLDAVNPVATIFATIWTATVDRATPGVLSRPFWE